MTGADWRLDEVEGVLLVRSLALASVPGVAHAFSTRRAHGRDDFDLGGAADATVELRARRAEFVRVSGLGSAPPALLRQVHGSAVVTAAEASARPVDADGVFSMIGEGAAPAVPAVRTADCVPVLLADRKGTAVAALHAGWRGVVAGIGPAAVSRLEKEGVPAADLVVALGPSIGACCYEVGDEVVSALAAACGGSRAHVARTPAGRTTVSLKTALRAQFSAAGVSETSVHAAPWCTRCRTDLFFSFRAEGSPAGRLMALIGPSAGP